MASFLLKLCRKERNGSSLLLMSSDNNLSFFLNVTFEYIVLTLFRCFSCSNYINIDAKIMRCFCTVFLLFSIKLYIYIHVLTIA